MHFISFTYQVYLWFWWDVIFILKKDCRMTHDPNRHICSPTARKRFKRILLFSITKHTPLLCTQCSQVLQSFPFEESKEYWIYFKCTTSDWLSYCCIFCTTCDRKHLGLSRVLILRLSWPPPKPSEAVWSHHKSQELLCHRDWCSRREEKLAENHCCVTGKDLQVGGGRTEGSREGGTQAGAEEGERVKESEGKRLDE